jgi:hypothetical protein
MRCDFLLLCSLRLAVPIGVLRISASKQILQQAFELCNNKCKFFIFAPLNFYNKVFHLSLSLTGIRTFHILNFSCQIFRTHSIASFSPPQALFLRVLAWKVDLGRPYSHGTSSRSNDPCVKLGLC